MKRFVMTAALAAASAFALTIAAPARACNGDCECARKSPTAKKGTKGSAKPAQPAEKPAASEKKADLGSAVPVAAGEAKCQCEKGGKNCTCAKGQCHCANCGKTQYTAGEAKCQCEKGGKNCTCAKGQCHCANCGKAEKRA